MSPCRQERSQMLFRPREVSPTPSTSFKPWLALSCESGPAFDVIMAGIHFVSQFLAEREVGGGVAPQSLIDGNLRCGQAKRRSYSKLTFQFGNLRNKLLTGGRELMHETNFRGSFAFDPAPAKYHFPGA